jgi:acyl dehydratase
MPDQKQAGSDTYDKRHYEDFIVGEVLTYGATLVTAETIIEFARQYDPEPYHLDAELAKDSIFGELVASGVHVAALYRRMNFDAYPNLTTEGSPGWDELRFIRPTKPGDVLSVRSTVMDMRPLKSRPTIGMIRFKQEIINQHDELKTSLIAVVFFTRRDDATA